MIEDGRMIEWMRYKRFTSDFSWIEIHINNIVYIVCIYEMKLRQTKIAMKKNVR